MARVTGAMNPVRIGCSGWVYKDWRGKLYPEKLPQREWLRVYAESFDTVEVNNTFYRLPSESAVRGWIDATPDDFGFTIKGSRYTTHIKRLISFEKYSSRFFGAIEPIARAGKLTAVLWQLAPNFRQDLDRLEAALNVVDGRPGRHCFEFRHESWFRPETYELLRSHDAALVIGDDPRWPFQRRQLTAGWTYIRLHRGSRGRRGKYSDAELALWRRRIAAWRARAEVLCYFNNDWEGFAPANARALATSFR
jgi:uncharacterized protein YecE (DUF72 family)